ncbi:hypothetical protein YC2023_118283 [Brassica napus]
MFHYYTDLNKTLSNQNDDENKLKAREKNGEREGEDREASREHRARRNIVHTASHVSSLSLTRLWEGCSLWWCWWTKERPLTPERRLPRRRKLEADGEVKKKIGFSQENSCEDRASERVENGIKQSPTSFLNLFSLKNLKSSSFSWTRETSSKMRIYGITLLILAEKNSVIHRSIPAIDEILNNA